MHNCSPPVRLNRMLRGNDKSHKCLLDDFLYVYKYENNLSIFSDTWNNHFEYYHNCMSIKSCVFFFSSSRPFSFCTIFVFLWNNLNLCARFRLLWITKFSNEFHKTILYFARFLWRISWKSHYVSTCSIYLSMVQASPYVYTFMLLAEEIQRHSKNVDTEINESINIDFSIRNFWKQSTITSLLQWLCKAAAKNRSPFNDEAIKLNQQYKKILAYRINGIETTK